MGKKRMDIMYGEKYGDVNDPKTSWKRAGTLLIDEESGRMSIKIDMMPVGKHFDGWLSVFEPREDGFQGGSKQQTAAPAAAAQTAAPAAQKDDVVIEDIGGDEPINLDDIPF